MLCMCKDENKIEGQGDGSAVKVTCCSSVILEFGYQNLYQTVNNPL